VLVAMAAGCVERADGGLVDEEVSQSVVYGADNRVEPWAYPDPAWRAIAERSVVALIQPSRLDRTDPEHIVVSGEVLGPSLGLCAGVPFFDQLRGARCSGTVIGDDLVLTAGHCVDRYRCDSRLYVFDWRYEAEGQLAAIAEADIYRCAEVLAWQLTDDDLDYAIVRLDRPVNRDRTPASVRPNDDALARDTPLTLIGFPNGLPVKIADGGHVNAPGGRDHHTFQAALDAFSGNSGSGVFGADGSVVGVLVRGESDYVARADCDGLNIVSENLVDAEDVVYVGRAMEALCARADVDHPVCQGTERSWCFPCAADGECRDGFGCGHFEASPAVSFCAPACTADADCRADHRCAAAGRCEPRVSRGCFEGDAWEVDACGRGVTRVQDCAPTEVCREGACALRAPGDGCAEAIGLAPVGQLVEGDLTAGYTRDFVASCGGSGVDAVYTFEVVAPTSFTAFVRGPDTVVSLRSACDEPASEVACNDDHDPPGARGSRIQAELTPGRYWLVVDVFGEEPDLFEAVLSFGESTCEDFCVPGRLSCDAEGVIACTPDATGCFGFEAGQACAQGEVCLNGRCGQAGEGDTCDEAERLEAIDQVITGDLSTGYGDQLAGSCNGAGPDRVWTFTLDRLTLVDARVRGFDSVLYLRSACEDPDSELACHDDVDRPSDLGSRVRLPLPAGEYSLILDAFDADVAPFALTLTFDPLCDDVCELGGTLCREGAARPCKDGPDGCRVWGEAATCDVASPCTNGTCDTVCPTICEAGATRCAEDGDAEHCAEGPEGCLDWVVRDRCAADTEVCAEGACFAVAEAPPPRVVRVGGGGCQAAPGHPTPTTTLAAALGPLLLALAVLRR